MSSYVMRDLHGAYDTMIKMLEKINFSSEDTLYILGDVVDRGPDGVKILQYVMDKPNIKMILGNHEYMCMQCFSGEADEIIRRRWNRNGNYTTLAGFDKISEQEKKEVLNYIEQLPSEYRVEVNGRKFILVHGFIGENTHDRVWNRPKYNEKPEIAPDETLIIGHTPVCEFVCPGTDEDIYVYSRGLSLQNDHFRILHTEGFIDIDCCIGYGLSAARLACLRLDDMKEFYETVDK